MFAQRASKSTNLSRAATKRLRYIAISRHMLSNPKWIEYVELCQLAKYRQDSQCVLLLAACSELINQLSRISTRFIRQCQSGLWPASSL